MRTALALTALLVSVTANACGDSDPAGKPWTDPGASEPPAPVGRAAPAEAVGDASAAGPVSAPERFQCLVQGEVIVFGPSPRDVADGLTVEVLSFSVTDRGEVHPNIGAVYLFSDATSAATYVEAVRAIAIEDEDVDPATAVADLHGTAVLVADRALVPSAQETALLGCLPDADPPTVVAAPAPGTATLGSLLSCALAAGMETYAEHSFSDQIQGRLGFVKFLSLDGFGDLSERGRVWVFPDAAAAAAKEPELVDGEPERYVLRGNTVAEFPRTVDEADPETAIVLGCLPA